jgi:hypothetical protein
MTRLRFEQRRGENDQPDLVDVAAGVIRGLCYTSTSQLGEYLTNSPRVVEFKFRSRAAAQEALYDITLVFEQMASIPNIDIVAEWPELRINGITWDVRMIGGQAR